MMYILSLLHTLLSRLLLVLIILIFLLPVTFFMLLPQRVRYNSKLFFWMMRLFYRAVLRTSLLPINIIGREHIPTSASIIAANHQSSYDIPLVGQLANGHAHVWLAMAALRKSPLLRFILPRVAVLVDTSTPMKGMRSLLQAMAIAKEHDAHIMIFPEGGRFTDGTVHDFFGGFAILAKRMARPVVPVYIHGINKVYPPDAFWVHWHPVTVVVGEPFNIHQGEDDDAFKQRVYAWFVDQANKEYRF